MAERIPGLTYKGNLRKYPWSLWCAPDADGHPSVWKATYLVDFDCLPRSFIGACHNRASRMGMSCTTELIGTDTVVFSFEQRKPARKTTATVAA